MTSRKTMRPVTLKRVIEICSLASKNKVINASIVSEKLRVSRSRAEEIILEVRKMELLESLGDGYAAKRTTEEFLEHFEHEQWDKIHEYFLENYQFYGDYFTILNAHINDEKGLSLEEIKEESTGRQLSLNQTAIEVLSDWCDRLGTIQRNLYTRRVYALKADIELKIFEKVLCKSYQVLSTQNRRKGVFVEIPELREEICEHLKISRKAFDEKLHTIYLNNVGRIELSGAPLMTLAKKSPLTERKMKHVGKTALLSPKYEIKREREGLTVGQRVYYYLAIYEDH
ncbi:MAG: hypothetical protein QXX08_09395 [Candidatus Bathyarchaeia archaeon]